MSEEIPLSLAAGDITYLENGWYVTHTGLLRLARRNRCAGIQVQPAVEFCEPSANRWAFKATVAFDNLIWPTCDHFIWPTPGVVNRL